MAATDEEGWLVLIGGRCTDSSILSRLKSQTFHTPRHLDTWKQRSQRPPSLYDSYTIPCFHEQRLQSSQLSISLQPATSGTVKQANSNMAMVTTRTVKWTTLLLLICISCFLASFNATMRFIVDQRKE